MLKLKDVLQLAWNGTEWKPGEAANPDWTLTLDLLILMTLPSDGNTYWSPPVESVADWTANQSAGGNDLDRAKAEEVRDQLLASEPWNEV